MTADQLRAAQYIITLAHTFPSLVHLASPDPEDWDVDNFMKRFGVLSSGEKHAALFLVNVWNPSAAKAKGWIFDAIDAAVTWDTAHRRAFLQWFANPNLP